MAIASVALAVAEAARSNPALQRTALLAAAERNVRWVRRDSGHLMVGGVGLGFAVGYRLDAGEGVQFLLATDESTGPDTDANPLTYEPLYDAYDCALVSMKWTDYGLVLVDHWDDDREIAGGAAWSDSCSLVDAADGVNGFVGEPVPVAPGAMALRRRGETYRFIVSASGVLTRAYRVRWVPGVDELVPGADAFRIPAEHAMVIGDYPDSETVERIGFHAIQDTSNEHVAVVLGYDTSTGAIACTSGTKDCPRNPYDPAFAITTLPVPTGYNGPIWAPGAAAVYGDLSSPGDPSLAYVLPTGAITPVEPELPGELVACTGGAAATSLCVDNVDLPTLMGCNGDTPPRLHIYYKLSTDATWSEDWIDLGSYCYEWVDDGLSEAGWEPIDIVSSVAVQGRFVYVATNDGRFWEVDTSQSGLGRRTLNYAEGWPRVRRGNDGRARSW